MTQVQIRPLFAWPQADHAPTVTIVTGWSS